MVFGLLWLWRQSKRTQSMMVPSWAAEESVSWLLRLFWWRKQTRHQTPQGCQSLAVSSKKATLRLVLFQSPLPWCLLLFSFIVDYQASWYLETSTTILQSIDGSFILCVSSLTFFNIHSHILLLFSARVSRQQHSALPTDECATVYIIMPIMSGRERYVLRIVHSGIWNLA